MWFLFGEGICVRRCSHVLHKQRGDEVLLRSFISSPQENLIAPMKEIRGDVSLVSRLPRQSLSGPALNPGEKGVGIQVIGSTSSPIYVKPRPERRGDVPSPNNNHIAHKKATRGDVSLVPAVTRRHLSGRGLNAVLELPGYPPFAVNRHPGAYIGM
jgi:hypothetical protein